MQIKLRCCSLAEREHQQNLRWYAHTYHYDNTICVCEDFWGLPKKHFDAILLHEIGHIIAGPTASEAEANRVAEELSGSKIKYVDSPYGKRLEKLVS